MTSPSVLRRILPNKRVNLSRHAWFTMAMKRRAGCAQQR